LFDEGFSPFSFTQKLQSNQESEGWGWDNPLGAMGSHTLLRAILAALYSI